MRRFLPRATLLVLVVPLVACAPLSVGPSDACVRGSEIAEDLSVNVPQTRMLEDPEGSKEELLNAASQLGEEFPKLADRITTLAERFPANSLVVTDPEMLSYSAAASDFQAAAEEFDQSCGIS